MVQTFGHGGRGDGDTGRIAGGVGPATAFLAKQAALPLLGTSALPQLPASYLAQASPRALPPHLRPLHASPAPPACPQAAKEGVTAAASRYAAARSLLGLVGPLMWASTALDLLFVSIGTDWSRVVKAVFALAQIRLLRTYGFSAAGSAVSASGGGSGSGGSGAPLG